MKHESYIVPPNSVILVLGQSASIEIPPSMTNGVVQATESCIAIGTLSSADGPTFVSLSDELLESLATQASVFDDTLNTPLKRLTVCTVLKEEFLGIDVPASQTRIRIWVNHASEPDKIWIVAGTDSNR